MTFKELREQAGFENGARLAKLAGIDQTTISQLDAGKIANPRYGTVEALADVLGLPTGAVMKAIRHTVKRVA
jgi:transcriptional regulator with XRE-family HTH domain